MSTRPRNGSPVGRRALPAAMAAAVEWTGPDGNRLYVERRNPGRTTTG